MKIQREKKHIEAGSSRRGTALMSISGNREDVQKIEKILDRNWSNTMCEDEDGDELTIFYSVPSNMEVSFRTEYRATVKGL